MHLSNVLVEEPIFSCYFATFATAIFDLMNPLNIHCHHTLHKHDREGVLHQNQEAGHPRRPCCRMHCGGPEPRPAASSPTWNQAECPQTWSLGSLCWAWSLRGSRAGLMGNRTPACGVRNKDPAAAAAGAREEDHNGSSKQTAGKLCPPHTSPRCPWTARRGPVHFRASVLDPTEGYCWGFLPEEGAPFHLDSPSPFNDTDHTPEHRINKKTVSCESDCRECGFRQRLLLCWRLCFSYRPSLIPLTVNSFSIYGFGRRVAKDDGFESKISFTSTT